jgi:hypothetical protein
VALGQTYLLPPISSGGASLDVMTAILVRFKWHGDGPGQERARSPIPPARGRQTTDPRNKAMQLTSNVTELTINSLMKLTFQI